MLRGGTISENKHHGVDEVYGGEVTVAKAEEGRLQTVSRDSEQHDWATNGQDSAIIGIPQEKINV